MAHSPTEATREKVRALLASGLSNANTAKELKISVNTFKKKYQTELEEAINGTENNGLKHLRRVSKTRVFDRDDRRYPAGELVTSQTVADRYKIELSETYLQMGPVAMDKLLNRVRNGTKETRISYDVTEWNEDGTPKTQKVTAYVERTKECTTRDIQTLIDLTTNGISFKDAEIIRISKEIHGIKDGLPDVKDKTLDYSKLSTEDLIDLKVLLGKARIDG